LWIAGDKIAFLVAPLRILLVADYLSFGLATRSMSERRAILAAFEVTAKE